MRETRAHRMPEPDGHRGTPYVAQGPARSRERRRAITARAVCAILLALTAACYQGRVAQAPAAPEPTQPLGWTPLNPSSDSLHVYVSSSSGSDTYSGLSEDSAKRTLKGAIKLLRDGYPDWLHFMQGDTFVGGLGDWRLSGRSADEPMVVTSYGSAGVRPRFLCHTDNGVSVHSVGVHDVAFVGLDFHDDDRNGVLQSYGVSLLAPSTRVLIEDCAISSFFVNLRLQGNHHDLKLRRSVITDAFTVTEAHAEGIYVEGVDGLLIEQCLFDHNGWSSVVPGAEATVYRHNVYLQGNTSNMVVRGNIIARAGSHGIQARSGGVIRDNVFLGNAINMLIGNNILNNGAVTATVVGNVILDGRDIVEGDGRGWAAHFQCLAAGEIAYNVAAHQVTGTAPKGYMFDSTLGVGVNDTTFHDNVAYKWGAPLMLIGNRFSGLQLRNNDVQELGSTELFHADYSGAFAGFTSAANRLFTSAPTDEWMFYDQQQMSLDEWRMAVNDAASAAVQVSYPRPEETVADYDVVTGGGGSLESFLERARLQTRANWNDDLVGTNVAAYFCANFGVHVPD